MTTYNVYCDESGHLPNDRQPVMVLGAIWCPLDRVREMSEGMRALKGQFGLAPRMEIKWTKISPAKLDFYLALVDFFFAHEPLQFRALVVPDKTKLNHEDYDQDHDTWYFKMYYSMLKVIIAPNDRYRVYLDIKDTRSAEKVCKLHQVLCNTVYDFDQNIIERVQTVRSHEVELLQLADLLIGAVRCANRGSPESAAKDAVVKRVQARSRYRLVLPTLLAEKKFNLFIWRAREKAT
ncbi:MAG: DUF3800 domain-containing protein [Proteobacteria bacterium]|jgi:hypothetical protein|nr:DUF3800 domain-containing protein [Pseudomonadota bacterium]